MRVALTCAEMMQAGLAGVMRQVENVKKKRVARCGKDQWTSHIEGAMAECVVAKSLDLYWPGKGVFCGPDVSNLQVRSTPYVNGCLALQPDDDDEAIFILVTGRMGIYNIRGWIKAKDGKRPEWWEHKADTHRPSFYVPQSALATIATLGQT